VQLQLQSKRYYLSFCQVVVRRPHGARRLFGLLVEFSRADAPSRVNVRVTTAADASVEIGNRELYFVGMCIPSSVL